MVCVVVVQVCERERVVLREMGFGEGENNKKWKNNEYFIE